MYHEVLLANASGLMDYIYPEDLVVWRSSNDIPAETGIRIFSEFRRGELCCINKGFIQQLFVLELLRRTLSFWIPVIFLSMDDDERIGINDSILSVFRDSSDTDAGVLGLASSRIAVSKRLRARRFCEVEDELRALARKGYRIAVITCAEDLPPLDAESKEKGYAGCLHALSSVAADTGLSIIAMCWKLPDDSDQAVCPRIPERVKFILPRYVTVVRNGSEKERFRFTLGRYADTEPDAAFQIGSMVICISE